MQKPGVKTPGFFIYRPKDIDNGLYLFFVHKQKARRFHAGLFSHLKQELTRLDVRGLLALGTLNNFESHFLTFFERLEAAHVDRGEVREQVFAAVIGSDETETLSVVEPFNSTVCHALLPYKKRRVEMPVKLFEFQDRKWDRTWQNQH